MPHLHQHRRCWFKTCRHTCVLLQGKHTWKDNSYHMYLQHALSYTLKLLFVQDKTGRQCPSCSDNDCNVLFTAMIMGYLHKEMSLSSHSKSAKKLAGSQRPGVACVEEVIVQTAQEGYPSNGLPLTVTARPPHIQNVPLVGSQISLDQWPKDVGGQPNGLTIDLVTHNWQWPLMGGEKPGQGD